MRGLILWFSFSVNIGTNMVTEGHQTQQDEASLADGSSEKSKFHSTNVIIGFSARVRKESRCLATRSHGLKRFIWLISR